MSLTRNPNGLCDTCRHVRRIESRRGSVFILCERSTSDPDRFPRYPRLPMLACSGYVACVPEPPPSA